MRQFREIGAILSGILRIMHPDQYRLGIQTLRAMEQFPKVKEALKQWPTPFSAIAIIANRASPMHREQRGHFQLFDVLLSVGTYGTAPLMVEPLGIQMKNGPGTVYAFSGRLCRHGVAFADGARTCYALYMRPEITRFCDVYPCSWMTQDTYKSFVGDDVARNQFVFKASLNPL